jgi:signal transduction histidine kinase
MQTLTVARTITGPALQLAVCAALLATFWSAAIMFRRRTLWWYTAVWSLGVVTALLQYAQHHIATTAGRGLAYAVVVGATIGCAASIIPLLRELAASLAQGREPGALRARTILAWAGGTAVAVAGGLQLTALAGPEAVWIGRVWARAVAFGLFASVAWAIARRWRRAVAPRTSLALLGAGVALLVARVVVSALGAAGWLGNPDEPRVAFALLVAQVLLLISVGAAFLLGALHVDREAIVRQERRLREAEARLAQIGRMESLGRLAGGVAHDFGNILAAITLGAGVIRERSDDPDLVREEIDEIERASRRGRDITRQLLTFSRERAARGERVAPNARVAELTAMLTRLLGRHIRLVVDTDPAVDDVHLDATQLEQLVVNLVLNARDAMPGGGEVRIATARCVLSAPLAVASAELPPGRYVRLAIEDTGTGIPSDVLPSIFEPFFSTKGPEGGTGLGLATCYGVARSAGGGIAVRSQVGRGTRFEVYLPAAGPVTDPSARCPTAEREAPAAVSGDYAVASDPR